MPCITLRDFQAKFVELAFAKAQAGARTLSADVHPGAGKTLSFLAAADVLFTAGFIDAVLVLVPRLNLAKQFEQDWAQLRDLLPWQASLGPLYHTDNGGPLFYDGADGYITTYDSLMSNPEKHYKALRGKRFLLACDEAQQLGIDYAGRTTRSAECVKQLGEMASFIIAASGTPFRADGSKLLFAEYEEPDAGGVMQLKADIRSTYREGVRDGYLRPFEAVLFDGSATLQELGADAKTVQLSKMHHAMRQILEHSDYWQPLVDRFVAHVFEQKDLVHPDLCGLVAASAQDHAREIMAYLKKQHPNVRALLAVSDEREAHKALSDFRRGGHDVLVTVNMAHVGYDHKPINSVLVLTPYRTEGYLRQLTARGLRLWDQVEPGAQTCYVFAPDDLAMRDFAEMLREESSGAGAKVGASRRYSYGDANAPGSAEEQVMSTVLDAELGGAHARGLNADLSPAQYEIANEAREELGIAVPATTLVAWAQRVNPGFQIGVTDADDRSMRERMREAKSALKEWSNKCDHRVFNGKFGSTYGELKRQFGPTSTAKSVEEVQKRIATVTRWYTQGYVG